MIKGYVFNLNTNLKEAEELNERLINLIPEEEQDSILIWYEEQFERVQDNILQAKSVLNKDSSKVRQ